MSVATRDKVAMFINAAADYSKRPDEPSHIPALLVDQATSANRP
jgi:hypothetical protein